jgi:hypothetical protein
VGVVELMAMVPQIQAVAAVEIVEMGDWELLFYLYQLQNILVLILGQM